MNAMTAMPDNPTPVTTAPPHNPNARYYWESYVWEDPSWTLTTKGWLDVSADKSQAYNAARMLAAQYNLPVRTRVWDQDAGIVGVWGGWVPVNVDASGYGGAGPVLDTAESALETVALVAGAITVAWLLWRGLS